MPNHPKKTDGYGNLWCPGCERFLPSEAFAKVSEKKRSFHGVQTWCRSCQREHRIMWKSKPETHLRDLVRRAGKRNRDFSLTPEWTLRQYEKQEGKCFYTGIQMTFDHGNGRSWSNASIDRVDSSKGYTPDNCVLCCTGFNLMKTNLPIEALTKLARAFLKNYHP